MARSLKLYGARLMANSCDSCKYWQLEEQTEWAHYAGNGECMKPKPFWTVSEYEEINGNYRRVLTAEHKTDLMFVQDGSDYRAHLLTNAKFYCACFEKKD